MPPNLNQPDWKDDADLERELRRALQRVEPERDFSGLSYARPLSGKVFWMRSRTVLALAGALLVLLLLPAGVIRYRNQRQRAEQARAQLLTALRITGSKLEKTRQMVVRDWNRRNSL